MVFDKIFIEGSVQHHHRTQTILQGLRLPLSSATLIDTIDDVFGKVKKPYLHKRTTLNLFIGEKKGTLVKTAPPAYGNKENPHYYFIHAYNCLYECEYCYLQGHFNSPDLVLFINHEEIGAEIKRLSLQTPPHLTSWFHAGEFSDSLALSHLTQEWPFYFKLFEDLPRSKLELRTKAANIKILQSLTHNPQVVISFSLSPDRQCRLYDRKAPSLKARLQAIEKLSQQGYQIGLHFDPIIYFHDSSGFLSEYSQLFQEIAAIIKNPQLIEAISFGVIRFTKEVFHQVRKNYPNSPLLAAELTKSFDGKVRYKRPFRLWILNSLKQLCLASGLPAEKIYLCMEESS